MFTDLEYMLPDAHRYTVSLHKGMSGHQDMAMLTRTTSLNFMSVLSNEFKSGSPQKKYHANFTISQGRNRIMSLQNYLSLIPDLFDS